MQAQSKKKQPRSNPKPKKNKQPKAQSTKSAPLATATRNVGEPARISNSGRGRVTVTHREYVADIDGSVLFNTVRHQLNPGLPTTFPWLSRVAGAYDAYRCKALKADYVATCPATTAGTISMLIDYDAADPTPLDKAEMLNSESCCSTSAWSSISVTCNQKSLNLLGPDRYIRYEGLAVNQDVKTYDVGSLIIAVDGQSGTAPIGQLWLTYTIEFSSPQVGVLNGYQDSVRVSSGGVVSKAAIFGTAATAVGLYQATAATNTLNFLRPGQYLVAFDASGTGIITPVPVFTGFTSAATISSYNAATSISQLIRVVVPNTGLSNISWDMSASTTITGSSARIAAYQYSDA